MFGDLQVFEVLGAGAQDRPAKLRRAVSKATNAQSGDTHLRPATRANAPVQQASMPKPFPMYSHLFWQRLRTSSRVGCERHPSLCRSTSQYVRRSAAFRAAGNQQSESHTPARHEPARASEIPVHCRVPEARADPTSAKAALTVDRPATNLLAEPRAQASEPPRPQMDPL